MPNTYSQIYIQIVIAVKGRQNLISKQNREILHKYITGIVQNKNHKMLAIFAMPDHMHMLIGLKANFNLSDLVRDVKACSSKFINDNQLIFGKFNWQEGFGAFSYSKNQINSIISYIRNQEEHHKKETFKEEYINILNQFEIEYNEKYLFEWID